MEEGINMSEEVYTYLVKELGYGSLEEADFAQLNRRGGSI
jgi:hypothetical protein